MQNWLKNWKHDTIKHNFQTDGSSCGVHVIEVKKLMVVLEKETELNCPINIIFTINR